MCPHSVEDSKKLATVSTSSISHLELAISSSSADVAFKTIILSSKLPHALERIALCLLVRLGGQWVPACLYSR